MRLVACDTEVTGLDLYHGARPFLVTVCILDNSKQDVTFYEWPVNPLTRQPEVPEEDLDEIEQVLRDADYLVGQNIKFDVSALTLLFQDHNRTLEWDWSKTYDTLIAGHLLASNQPHGLDSMAIQYLGEDIGKYEAAVKKAVLKARFLAKHDLPKWQIAVKGGPLTPSAKGSTWGFDMWLPAAVANEYNYSKSHPWRTVVAEYANIDSVTTAFLWQVMEKKIRGRGLWKLFLERMKLVPIAMELEARGVTLSASRLESMIEEYREVSKDLATTCRNIAHSYGYELALPKSGNNRSLQLFCFGSDILLCKNCGYSYPISRIEKLEALENPPVCTNCGISFNSEGGFRGRNSLIVSREPYLDLPAIKRSANTGEPSLDKQCLETYCESLPPRSKSRVFVRSLKDKRKRDTAITYLNGYKRFWLPIEGFDNDWYMLHGSANPTGTDTLRWSFSNPNSSNIGKQKDEKTGEDFNLRRAFGPAPDREWWSMDGENLELRIPAYEAGEKDLIYVFEHPKEPPYFGSYHLVVFDALYPELFKKHGKSCKTLYESTYYQWVKNGNFATLYGAQEPKADATYHMVGAYQKVRYRFPRMAELSDRQITHANKYGYVTTIPDKEVDSSTGYPINCTRTDYGKVLPTVPLNYHIQSTAMWWTGKCMIKCSKQLKEWQKQGFDAYITLQVHDELVFSFPRSNRHPKRDYDREKSGKPYFRTSNLWRARILQRLMESCGDGIGVPTTVGVEYNKDNWAEGESF